MAEVAIQNRHTSVKQLTVTKAIRLTSRSQGHGKKTNIEIQSSRASPLPPSWTLYLPCKLYAGDINEEKTLKIRQVTFGNWQISDQFNVNFQTMKQFDFVVWFEQGRRQCVVVCVGRGFGAHTEPGLNTGRGQAWEYDRTRRNHKEQHVTHHTGSHFSFRSQVVPWRTNEVTCDMIRWWTLTFLPPIQSNTRCHYYCSGITNNTNEQRYS